MTLEQQLERLKKKVDEKVTNCNTLHCKFHDRVFWKKGKCTKCEEEILNLKKRSGIPTKFLNTSFENFIIENDTQRSIVNKLINFKLNSNLIMSGATGRGKTHLAIALLNNMIEQRITGYYVAFYDLTDKKLNYPDEFYRIRNCEFLIIDEYGISSSEFKSSLLYEIVESRYKNGLFTGIITNKNLKEFSESIIDPLKSRLLEGYLSLVFDGKKIKDYRLK